MRVKWPLERREEIVWRDHMGSGGWADPQQYASEGLALCRSLGYVLRENRVSVTMMQSQSATVGHVDHSVTIAKRLIVSRRRIR